LGELALEIGSPTSLSTTVLDVLSVFATKRVALHTLLKSAVE
jgi:hypothetical protein